MAASARVVRKREGSAVDVEITATYTQEEIVMNQRTHIKVGIAPTLSVNTATRGEVVFTMAAPDGSSLIMQLSVKPDNVVEIRDMLSAWIDANRNPLEKFTLNDLLIEIGNRFNRLGRG